jgi:hypothetical protein
MLNYHVVLLLICVGAIIAIILHLDAGRRAEVDEICRAASWPDAVREHNLARCLARFGR